MDRMTETLVSKANILIEALPYIQHFSGKLIVVKYGGNAMLNEDLMEKVLQDITLLKYVGVNPIVVHGGGPDINKMLKELNIESKFHNGLRITDEKTMEIAQMVLVGKTNKEIVSRINQLGGKAIGLCGKDANLIEVEKAPSSDGVDLGYVGKVTKINTELLHLLSSGDYIPVIAPIGIGPDGKSYNINADTVAGEVASAMKAEKMMFLTDIDGIRIDPSDPSTLLPEAKADQIQKLIDSGVISGGMIPKVQGCIDCVNHGVTSTHILDGTVPHPLLLEIFTHKGIGTMVTK